jgi:hypothetical protein
MDHVKTRKCDVLPEEASRISGLGSSLALLARSPPWDLTLDDMLATDLYFFEARFAPAF